MTARSPVDDWPVWLASSDVPADEKTARLAEFVAVHGALPEGCEAAWTELKQLALEGRLADALLPRLCRQLPPKVLAAWFRSTPGEQIRSFLAPLIYLCSTDPALTQALSAAVRALDDEQLSSVIQHLGALAGFYPKDEPMMGQRLLAVLRKLPQDPARFSSRVAALRAGARWMPKEVSDRVRAWRQFEDSFEAFVRVCQHKGSLLTTAKLTSEREDAAQRMAAALREAMPADLYPSDQPASVKLQLVAGLIAAANVPRDMLPEELQRDAAIEQVLRLTPGMDHGVWKESPERQTAVGDAVRQKLAAKPLDTVYLDRILQSAEYLPLMLEIAIQGGGNEDCRASAAYLVERIPLDRLDKLPGSDDTVRVYRLHALQSYVARHMRLPNDCAWLWTERPSKEAAKPPLAVDLFKASCVTSQVIQSSLANVPRQGVPSLFRGVLRAQIATSEKRKILEDILAQRELDLGSLMADLRPDVSVPKYQPLLKAVLAPWLRQVLNGLHLQPKRFAASVPVLVAALPLLGGDPMEIRVKAWSELGRILERAQRHQPTGLHVTDNHVREFTDQLTSVLNRCFSEQDGQDEECQDLRDRRFHEIRRFVEGLAVAYQVSDLLPSGKDAFAQHLFAVFKGGTHERDRLQQEGAWVPRPARFFEQHRKKVILTAAGFAAVLSVVFLWGGVKVIGSLARSFAGGGETVAEGNGQSPGDEPKTPREGSPDEQDATEAEGESASQEKAKFTPSAPQRSSRPGTFAGYPVAQAPLEDVVEGTVSDTRELWRVSNPSDVTLDLHGCEVLNCGYRIVDGADGQFTDAKAERSGKGLDITAARETGERVSIASIDMGSDGSIQLKPNSPLIFGLRDAQRWLPFCILEIRFDRDSVSRYVALKPPRPLPEPLKLALDASRMRSHATLDLEPTDAPPNAVSFCLGAGGLKCGNEGFVFGTDATAEDRLDRWPLADFCRKKGLAEFDPSCGLKGVSIHLESSENPEALTLSVETEPLYREIQDSELTRRITDLRGQLDELKQWKNELPPSGMSRAARRREAQELDGWLDSIGKKTVAEKQQWAREAAVLLGLEPRYSADAKWVLGNLHTGTLESRQKSLMNELDDVMSSEKAKMHTALERAFQSITSLEADVYRIVEIPKGVRKEKIFVPVLVIGTSD
jgi:hypothetical protein